MIMHLSKSSVVSQKSIPHVSDNLSTWYLLQAWYIRQEIAWVFNYLPLGLKVIRNIQEIIKKHLEKLWAEEILMSSIGSKEHWQQTGRDNMDIIFKLPFKGDKHEFLNPTHEEIVVPLMQEFMRSYKNLPASVFQTQTKFRNEARAKSGLLRGREFIMNDMYSFHQNVEDLEMFYNRVIQTYHNIFQELGIGNDTYLTFASGGAFSEFSHEFQTILPIGEDIIYVDKEKKVAINKEIYGKENVMKKFEWYNFEESKASEAGNIFKLGTKFSKPFGMEYTDENWKNRNIEMGCYGIGVSRAMGIIAEKFSDDRGLVWPENITPYDYYIIQIRDSEKQTDQVCEILDAHKKTYIIDDTDRGYGAKAKDADLFGIPQRIVVSEKNMENNQIEYKERIASENKYLSLEELWNVLSAKI